MSDRSALRPLGYLLRRLRRAPVFSLVVIATLAVSLGALASVYAVVRAVLLEALPCADSGRLMRVENRPVRDSTITYEVSYADYVVLERESRAVAALAGFASNGEGLLVGDSRSSLERIP